jgi:hypothetical protein
LYANRRERPRAAATIGPTRVSRQEDSQIPS